MTVSESAPAVVVGAHESPERRNPAGAGAHPVVAGVSGSPGSRHAVEAAAMEAATRGRPLRLVHTVTWHPGAADPSRPVGDLLRGARAQAARVAPGLRITTERLEGQPLTGLLRLSRHAVLTVIGDGNLNERTCLPREATAVQLAARAFGSVLVTRVADPPDGPVLVGVSGCDVTVPVLAVAFDEAARRHTGLLVVHVGDDPRRAEVLADTVALHALRSGVEARFRTLTGDPTTVLRRESREASLIVVGARGESPYHGLLGSVTQTVLHHGYGPVVIVRGTAGQGTSALSPGRRQDGAPLGSPSPASSSVPRKKHNGS
ncbi:universal stress protein [Actinoplanes rectilineatus]|uniref:universal stress protein n=1 Tax=Actinoplanes rectilineatus TaxID=113571 RepID=UPI000ABE17BE|nr:universal stress protein [Actinoplanes rectilineatus]